MFCPRCNTENNLEQKYCRQCGLQLTAVRIALRGDVDEALARHKKGEWLVSGGSIFLIFSVLAALANVFLNSGPWNYAVIINLLVGLVVSVPLITIGTVRLRGARHDLQTKDEGGQLAGDYPQSKETLAASVNPTGRLLSPVEAPESITEGTTRHLTTSERKR